jgi:PTS system nitrogen regulatory IIA component
MNLDTLISSNAVINTPDIKSKKRALEVLAETLASQPAETLDALELFQLLTEREKLGSTSIGHGVALPHARTNLTDQAIGAFLKLDNGIDFDSPDGIKTDLIFALLVPEHYTDEHLKILAYTQTSHQLADRLSGIVIPRSIRQAPQPIIIRVLCLIRASLTL